jgi:hypothetical protein
MTRSFNLRLSIAGFAFLALAAQAADSSFEAPALPATHPQTTGGVTIGALQYATSAAIKQAFGKMDPLRYGVLPVYLIIENKSGKTVSLKNLKAEYRDAGGTRVEATPAEEVRYVGSGPTKPNINPSPLPYPRRPRVKKGPLNNSVFEERALAAQVLPDGDTGRGFLYFQTGFRDGATVTISGLRETASGTDLFYVEIPLSQ